MIFNYPLFGLFLTALFLSPLAHANKSGGALYDEKKVLVKVTEVYKHYRESHPNCNYQATPDISIYHEQSYTLVNPYQQGKTEVKSIDFRMRNFVLESTDSNQSDPYCGPVSVKCASYGDFLNSSDFYCERIHQGKRSDPGLLMDQRYNQYLAYEALYYLSVMSTAQKNFGLLAQYTSLDAFRPYSPSQGPNPSYEYEAVSYSTFNYPAPTGAPNYNNGQYGFLFLGSAENLKTICKTIQHDQLSDYDAGVRFNQYLGIPPDSPDVIRKFTWFKLRNNPHESGRADGNMFRPCPDDGNISSLSCAVSALVVPHDCNNPPLPYDGTTVRSFLENQYYGSYCNTTPNSHSGMPVLYPWTGQGFTYDWYPWHVGVQRVQGASEYIPATNAGSDNIEVLKQQSLHDFLERCEFN